MERIWVIEAKFSKNSWEICDFADRQYAHVNYYEAQKIKRQCQEWLFKTGSRDWTKDRFRVVEYVRSHKHK